MTTITAAKIIIPVTTTADKATKKVTGLEKALRKTGLSAKQSAVAMKLFRAALPLAGVALFITGLKKVFELTARQQAVEAQLNAVLKSTGQVAGLTAKELTNLASSLQAVTTFGDEAIIEAEALLLTFTKVGRDVFPRATETILNMAQAMKTDLKTATIQVGKALNDPIQGIGALRRVGVQLSASQEQLVKQFIATGQVAKAQGVILGELETQFGGVARAATQTLGGSIKQLQNTFGDLLQAIGQGPSEVLIKVFNGINTAITALIPVVRGIFDAFGAFLGVVGETVGITIRFLKTALAPLFDNIKGSISPLKILKKAFELVGVALRGIEPIIQLVAKGIGLIINAIGKVINFFLKQIQLFFKGLAFAADKLAEIGIISKSTARAFNLLSAEVTKSTDASKGFTSSISTATAGLKNYRQEGLQALAAAGDITAQLALLNQKFAEQAKIVQKAGMSTVALENFYQKQRTQQLQAFFAESATIAGGSFADRQAAVDAAYSQLLDSDNLSYEERLAAQSAYIEQSKALERDRLTAINESAQLIGGIAQQSIDLGQKVTDFQNAQIESQIEKLKEQGASEEEIAKKRNQLRKKQAKEAKIFNIFTAIINTALGITNALATLPPPASFVVAALTAAVGAASVATIAAQSVPSAQFGGNFTVPPGNDGDGGLLRVNTGEDVSVTPTRFSGNGGGGRGLPDKVILMIGPQEFDAYFTEKLNQVVNSGNFQIRRKGAVRVS